MKLICTQENLSRSLSYLERVVGKQSTLPILSNFLLETEKGRLKISATNLEIGVITTIGSKIDTEGRIAIPAKLLSSFVHNLPEGEVLELESDGQNLNLSSSSYRMRIKGVDGKDFPIIPQYKEEYLFSFPAQELKNALSKILFCVSLNEARLELTGVQVSFFEEGIHVAATDSFRLGEVIIPFKQNTSEYQRFREQTPSLILPVGTLTEIIRVILPESRGVKMAIAEHQVFFEVDGVQIISRMINGKYPDYQQIIPKTYTFEMVMEKEAFLRAVKIASAFSSYSSGEITLALDASEKSCTFSSQSQEIGENITTLPVNIKKGEGKAVFVFHSRYLLEGMGALDSEFIGFLANGAAAPVALRKYDTLKDSFDGQYIYIVMPIKK